MSDSRRRISIVCWVDLELPLRTLRARRCSLDALDAIGFYIKVQELSTAKSRISGVNSTLYRVFYWKLMKFSETTHLWPSG